MDFKNYKHSLLLEAMHMFSLDIVTSEEDKYEAFDYWIKHAPNSLRMELINQFVNASIDNKFSWLRSAELAKWPITDHEINIWYEVKADVWERITNQQPPMPWFQKYLKYRSLISSIQFVLMDYKYGLTDFGLIINSTTLDNRLFKKNDIMNQFEAASFDKEFSWVEIVKWSNLPIEGDEEQIWRFCKKNIWDVVTNSKIAPKPWFNY